MATIKKIIIDNETYLLPKPLEVGEVFIDREKVVKALINAWKEDYRKLEKELKAFELIIKKNVVIPKLTLNQFFDISVYNKDLSEKQQLTDEERTIILEGLKVLEK